jgi:hypothetical protein
MGTYKGHMSKYLPEYADQAYQACKQWGATNIELAKLFGVSKRAIQNWLVEHEGFREKVLAGKEEFDSALVEQSLLKRAQGYDLTEETKEPFEVEDPETGEKKIEYRVTKIVTKHVPPSDAACRYWLNNRQPTRWKNVKHVELAGEGGGGITVEVVSYKDQQNNDQG